MSDTTCYVMTARDLCSDWVCCVFDNEADALAGKARSEAAALRPIHYAIGAVPFHSRTDDHRMTAPLALPTP